MVLTSDSRLQGLDDSLSLGEDGLPGPFPLPWPLQPVLVWGAWAKENLHGQLRVREKEDQQIGLHTHLGGDFVHVLNVIHLDVVVDFLHGPGAGGRAELSVVRNLESFMSTQFRGGKTGLGG